jgi:FkbM family methyltransferase
MVTHAIPSGIARSLSIYRAADPAREALMDDFYRAFIGAGDLVFDAGAHVGDRTACFRRLGARVVAIEPQPAAFEALRALHGDDPLVTLEPCAVGARCGACDMHLNETNPTVSTLSAQFIAATRGADGWQGQSWSRIVSVPVATLDALVARHGTPRFVKLDVEGWEAEALAGLTRPLPALSFEFTVIQKPVAFAAIARLAALGDYEFRASPGEFLTFETPAFVSRAEIEAWISDAPDGMGSGDIYARLRGG